MREREDANRTREAGNRDEVEDVVANTLNSFRNGAVGFIGWLDASFVDCAFEQPFCLDGLGNKTDEHQRNAKQEHRRWNKDGERNSLLPMYPQLNDAITESGKPDDHE